MCAAPGGKSVIMATLLFASKPTNNNSNNTNSNMYCNMYNMYNDLGTITVNEIDSARRTRLRRVCVYI